MSDGSRNRAPERAVGERLKEARKKLGLTQTSLAKAVGLTQQGWALIEAGKRKPPSDVLLKLRERGVDPDWVLYGTSLPPDGHRADDEADAAELYTSMTSPQRAAMDVIAVGIYNGRLPPNLFFELGFALRAARPPDREAALAQLKLIRDALVHNLPSERRGYDRFAQEAAALDLVAAEARGTYEPGELAAAIRRLIDAVPPDKHAEVVDLLRRTVSK